MKRQRKRTIVALTCLVLAAALATGCGNGGREQPDMEGGVAVGQGGAAHTQEGKRKTVELPKAAGTVISPEMIEERSGPQTARSDDELMEEMLGIIQTAVFARDNWDERLSPYDRWGGENMLHGLVKTAAERREIVGLLRVLEEEVRIEPLGLEQMGDSNVYYLVTQVSYPMLDRAFPVACGALEPQALPLLEKEGVAAELAALEYKEVERNSAVVQFSFMVRDDTPYLVSALESGYGWYPFWGGLEMGLNGDRDDIVVYNGMDLMGLREVGPEAFGQNETARAVVEYVEDVLAAAKACDLQRLEGLVWEGDARDRTVLGSTASWEIERLCAYGQGSPEALELVGQWFDQAGIRLRFYQNDTPYNQRFAVGILYQYEEQSAGNEIKSQEYITWSEGFERGSLTDRLPDALGNIVKTIGSRQYS